MSIQIADFPEAARITGLFERTPLEKELLRDLAAEALGDVEAALQSPFPRAALQLRFVERKGKRIAPQSIGHRHGNVLDRAETLFDRAIENLAEEMLNRFVAIADARIRRRTERSRHNAGA